MRKHRLHTSTSIWKDHHKLAKVRAAKRDMSLRDYIGYLIEQEEKREERREKEGTKRRRS